MKQYKDELKEYLGNGHLSEQEFLSQNTNVFYFAFIWNLFESICCNGFCDYTVLRTVSDDSRLLGLNSMNNLYKYFRDSYQSEHEEECFIFPENPYEYSFFSTINTQNGTLEFRPRSSDEKSWNECKNVFYKDKPSQEEKLKVLLFIAYRIRNNFFHGSKDLSKINYQDKIFEFFNALLLEIVQIIKPNYNSNS